MSNKGQFLRGELHDLLSASVGSVACGSRRSAAAASEPAVPACPAAAGTPPSGGSGGSGGKKRVPADQESAGNYSSRC